ncbi:hypothetical protein [Streptomyces sp. NPDC047869]|uniref:hypothetical protein n=1 Tax=Streptomyces sp. NPDC047869 TaxID=3154709 RepID=UPI00345170F3
MTTRPTYPCKRAGCRFTRGHRRTSDGQYKQLRMCSPHCRVWDMRAHRALKNGNADEAAELMRLSALLDARRSPREEVPGIFEDTRPAE